MHPSATERDRPRPTRTLFLDDSYTFGGAIISLARLVRGLGAHDIRSAVISGQPQSTMHHLFGEKPGIIGDSPVPYRHRTAVQRLLEKWTPTSGGLRSAARKAEVFNWLLTWTLPMTARYATAAFRHEAHLIHLNNSLDSQLPGFYAARLLGLPCVSHIRGFPQFNWRARRAARSVDRFIAVSTSVERQLLAKGIPEEQVTVVHDAVDVDEYASPRGSTDVREELGIPPDANVFGLLGRMVSWKGVEEFVAAAVRVLRTEKDAYALVVGDESDADPSYFRRVRELARESPVSDRVIFTGFREDVPDVIHTLDLLVHASTAPEPFGLVLVEAMAAGKPVVAADRGGPLDIVVDGETGLCVAPEDTRALARSIRTIINDADLARRMGERGQRRARGHFDIDRYASEVAEIYDDLLDVDR